MNSANPKITILLYGSSILIESLTSKLNQIEGWEVTRVWGGEVRGVDNLNFIVADLCDGATSKSLPMLTALPGVTLIGVDAISNTLTILTGRSHLSNSAQSVVDVLKKTM